MTSNIHVRRQADEAKKQEEAKGKIKYKLEYDFTTQELKVTVKSSHILRRDREDK